MFLGNVLNAVYSTGTAIAAVMFAGVLGQVETASMKAVGELGIAIVIAVTSFGGMAWYLKYHLIHQQKQADDSLKNQREDVVRMSNRINELESAVLELTKQFANLHIQGMEATKANTVAMNQLASVMGSRTCVALERLAPEKRAEVERMITE